MDVTAHLLYFVYNWFTAKLYCCYRWVFLYHNPFYAYHIIAYCNIIINLLFQTIVHMDIKKNI